MCPQNDWENIPHGQPPLSLKDRQRSLTVTGETVKPELFSEYGEFPEEESIEVFSDVATPSGERGLVNRIRELSQLLKQEGDLSEDDVDRMNIEAVKRKLKVVFL